MTERCIIFAGGDPVDGKNVSFDPAEPPYVICADKGLALAEALGIEPDLILGDFDSLGRKPEGDNVLTYPAEKDDTDLMLAVNEGLKRGFKRFCIYGACGGRLDHTIGNIECLGLLLKNGAQGEIVGDNDRVRLLRAGDHAIKRREGFSLSLFAYSEEVVGLTISGTKYTAQGITLKKASTLGVSNEITEDTAVISFTDGILTVIESRL